MTKIINSKNRINIILGVVALCFVVSAGYFYYLTVGQDKLAVNSANKNTEVTGPKSYSIDFDLSAVQLKDLKQVIEPLKANASGFTNSKYTLKRNFDSTTDSLVKFTVNNINVEFDLAGSQTPKVIQNGNKLTYQNILADTDLVYTSFQDYLKEDIVLKSASAPSSFAFNFRSSVELDYSLDEAGGIVARQGDTPIFYLQPLFASDAKGTKLQFDYVLGLQHTPSPVGATPLKRGMKSQQVVSVTSDSPLATRDSLVYPITIDPTTSFSFSPSDLNMAYMATPISTTSNNLPDYYITPFTAANLTSVGTDDASYATTTSGTSSLPQGEQSFTLATSTTWIASAGITNVSVVCVGPGGSVGTYVNGNAYYTGGGGGALAFANNITVTPGASYNIVVGAGGVGSAGYSSFNSSSCKAGAGSNGSNVSIAGGAGGTVINGTGGTGGTGTAASAGPMLGAGGGGAGGYSGAGGNAGYGPYSCGVSTSAGLPGAGGGGAGGCVDSGNVGSPWGIAGGGVGLFGQGADGVPSGGGGSGGSSAGGSYNISGGLYGGGAAHNEYQHVSGTAADGAVRIIWGSNRAFPSTNTGTLPSQSLRASTYATQLYEFNTKQYTNITQLTVNLIAYGTSPAGDGITARIWNRSSNSWEVLSSLTNTSSSMPSATSTQTVSTSIGNYLDAMGKVRILLSTTNPSSTTTSAQLYTDYMNLTILGEQQTAPPQFTLTGNFKTKGSVRFRNNPPPPVCGDAGYTVTDIDGNVYNTVLIGSQCWLKENMMTTKYPDGTSITRGPITATWPGTDQAYYAYPSNVGNTAEETLANIQAGKLGFVYQWSAAMHSTTTAGAQGICPTGWHVPTHDQYTIMERAICTSGTCVTDFPFDASTIGWRGTNEGSKLSTETSAGTNSSGFTAHLAGRRNTLGNFYDRSSYAYLWSSVESGGNAWSRYLGSGDARVLRTDYVKAVGFSVRCLKN